MKKWKYDVLLTGSALLAALVLWLIVGPGEKGSWAVVTVAGKEVARYPLAEEVTVRLGERDYNILTIAGGRASVAEANCGDLTCVKTGEISREGETIICLPHKLVVEIAGGEGGEFDAVSG